MTENSETEYELLEEEKPIKIFKILLAIFLIVIILTYFPTNPAVRDILAGLILSSTVEGYDIDINSSNKLFFSQNSYEELMKLYDENLDKEFKVCLKGKTENGNYFINAIHQPETIFQSHNKVIAELCPLDSLVSMHSHPIKHCLPSEQDVKNFETFKEKNPEALMAVICERGRFNFYS